MQKNKDINLEYIRTIACLGVVVIHVMKSAHDVFSNMSQVNLFICDIFVDNLRWCVPVFLMISGYLLLDPAKEVPLAKVGKYIWRIAVVLAVFGTGFAFLELVFEAKTIQVSMIPRAFYNMLTGNTWDHLWYLYTLIVLYCFLPLMKSVTSKLGTRELSFICVMIFLFVSLLPSLKALGLTLGIALNIMSVYMLYMFLGYMLRKGYLVIPAAAAISGLIATGVYFVFVAYGANIRHYEVAEIWYSHASIAVIVQSICVFSLLIKMPISKKPGLNRLILSCADNSFGIYIMHMLWINLIYKFFKITPERFGFPILLPVFVATCILTYISVWCMRRIRIVRKYM